MKIHPETPSSEGKISSPDPTEKSDQMENKIKPIAKEIMATLGLTICSFSYAVLAGHLFSSSIGAGIASAVAAVFLALADIVYATKLFSRILPPKAQRISQWIHAQCLEVFYLLGCHCLFPLSVRNWRWNTKSENRPLLLVHGYMNYNTVWLFHAKKWKEAGLGPIYTVNLGYPFRSIEQHAQKVKKKAEQIARETRRDDLILVGHSMGGLVSSYYATVLANPNTVTDVVTIGSPLQGTHLAKIGLGKCAFQMRRQSDFVDSLSQKILSSSFTRFYHIATESDQLVIPYHSCLLGDDPNQHYTLNNIGHVALLFSEKVNNKVVEWLRANY